MNPSSITLSVSQTISTLKKLSWEVFDLKIILLGLGLNDIKEQVSQFSIKQSMNFNK